MEPLAEKALAAVEKKELTIIPERFEKVYCKRLVVLLVAVLVSGFSYYQFGHFIARFQILIVYSACFWFWFLLPLVDIQSLADKY